MTSLDDAYQPGGHCSWVAPAYTRAGERLAVKIGWEHPEAVAEAEGLRFSCNLRTRPLAFVIRAIPEGMR